MNKKTHPEISIIPKNVLSLFGRYEVEHYSVGTIFLTLSVENYIVTKVTVSSVEIQIRIVSRIILSSTLQDPGRGFPVIPQQTFT